MLEVGRRVRPYVTPDDAAAVVALHGRPAVPGAAAGDAMDDKV